MINKILITGPSMDNVSGITEVVRNIINYSQYNYIHFITGSRDGEKKNIKWMINQVSLNWTFFKQLNSANIEVVHINTAFNTMALIRDFILVSMCRIKKSKILLHIHGGKYINEEANWFFKIIIKNLLLMADDVIVLSSSEKDYLCNEYGFESATILANCVDCKHPIRKFKKNGDSQLYALFLGRIEKDKGIFEALDAMIILMEKRVNIHFILCGTGSLKNEIVKKAENELSDNFTYMGVVKDEKKWQMIQKSDFFILPSYFEGLPMALLESMSVGVIPIVTAVGSIPSVITNEKNGYLTPKFDSQLMSNIIEKLSQNSALREKLSTNAFATSRKYCCSNYVKNLEKLYE